MWSFLQKAVRSGGLQSLLCWSPFLMEGNMINTKTCAVAGALLWWSRWIIHINLCSDLSCKLCLVPFIKRKHLGHTCLYFTCFQHTQASQVFVVQQQCLRLLCLWVFGRLWQPGRTVPDASKGLASLNLLKWNLRVFIRESQTSERQDLWIWSAEEIWSFWGICWISLLCLVFKWLSKQKLVSYALL